MAHKEYGKVMSDELTLKISTKQFAFTHLFIVIRIVLKKFFEVEYPVGFAQLTSPS
jgi:hypothetical protein